MRLDRLVFVIVFVGFATGCASSPGKSELVQLNEAAQQAYGEGRLKEAQALYTKLSKAVPEDPEIWFRLGNIYARNERLLDEAVDAYLKALEYDLRYGEAWHNLGVVKLRQAAAALMEAAANLPEDHPAQGHARALLQAIEGTSVYKPQVGESDRPRLEDTAPAPEPVEDATISTPEPVEGAHNNGTRMIYDVHLRFADFESAKRVMSLLQAKGKCECFLSNSHVLYLGRFQSGQKAAKRQNQIEAITGLKPSIIKRVL